MNEFAGKMRQYVPWQRSPASSLWPQLCTLIPLCRQFTSLDSRLLQIRLSRWIGPVPWPKRARWRACAPAEIAQNELNSSNDKEAVLEASGTFLKMVRSQQYVCINRGGAGILKVARPLQVNVDGGVYRGQQAMCKEANQLGWKDLYTTLFFPNSRFGNRKDRGWWGVSTIGLRVGLGWEAELLQAVECAISLAAARRIRMCI